MLKIELNTWPANYKMKIYMNTRKKRGKRNGKNKSRHNTKEQ